MTPIIGVIASSILKVTSSFESIATATGTGSSGTITFSSIPSTYKHLQIRVLARSTEAASGFTNLQVQVNGDTTTNYSIHNLIGDGSSVSANGYGSQSLMELGAVVRNNEAANIMGVSIIDIIDYASTTKNKTFRSFAGWDANGSGRSFLLSGAWFSTSAINSLTIKIGGASNYFTTNSTFSLYGIKGA
jgi:hypothetical protein